MVVLNIKQIVKFFIEMTGLTPTPDQEILLHKAITIKEQGHTSYNNILISSGFQSGKTLCAAVIVMWFMFEYGEEVRPVKIILVSAQENVIYQHIKGMFKRNSILVEKLSNRYKFDTKEMWIPPLKGFETDKGSILFVRKATEKSVLGFPADIVVIDEASRVKDEVVKDCLGRLTGDISKFILLSTPDVEISLFVKWVREVMDKKRKDFKLFYWSAEKLEWHSNSAEQLKWKEYTKEEYATKVLGRPTEEEERSFFPSKHINACIERCGEFSGREGGSKSYLEIGIDPSFTRTVLVVTEKIGTVIRKIIFYKIWLNKSIEDIAKEIGIIINNYDPILVKIDDKAGADVPVKGIIEKYTRKSLAYVPANKEVLDSITGKVTNHKEQMLGQLRRKVREHNLLIPEGFTELIEEMKRYRRGMSRGDDIVDAIALSCYEPSEPLVKKHSRFCGIFVFDEDKDKRWRNRRSW